MVTDTNDMLENKQIINLLKTKCNSLCPQFAIQTFCTCKARALILLPTVINLSVFGYFICEEFNYLKSGRFSSISLKPMQKLCAPL